MLHGHPNRVGCYIISRVSRWLVSFLFFYSGFRCLSAYPLIVYTVWAVVVRVTARWLALPHRLVSCACTFAVTNYFHYYHESDRSLGNTNLLIHIPSVFLVTCRPRTPLSQAPVVSLNSLTYDQLVLNAPKGHQLLVLCVRGGGVSAAQDDRLCKRFSRITAHCV